MNYFIRIVSTFAGNDEVSRFVRGIAGGDQGLDALRWQRNNKRCCSTIAETARDFLALPLSSACNYSFFRCW